MEKKYNPEDWWIGPCFLEAVCKASRLIDYGLNIDPFNKECAVWVLQEPVTELFQLAPLVHGEVPDGFKEFRRILLEVPTSGCPHSISVKFIGKQEWVKMMDDTHDWVSDEYRRVYELNHTKKW